MGIKVKCQHCWKIFEVVDDAAWTTQECEYCNRNTRAVPLEDNTEEKTKQSKITIKVKGLTILACITFGLSFINFLFTLVIIQNNSPFQDAVVQRKPQWVDKVDLELKGLQIDISNHKKTFEEQKRNLLIQREKNLENMRLEEEYYKTIYQKIHTLQEKIDKLMEKKEKK